MKIKIEAISSEGIDAYRIRRLMLDGTHQDINGIDWQDSPIFSGMHNGGGYVLQARDEFGNIAEKEIPVEEPLEVTAYGGYIFDGAIHVNVATNIPSQAYIEWGIRQEDDTIPRNSMGWTEGFSQAHDRPIPAFFMNAEHHYWITVRSQYNQVVPVNGRYIITPDTVKIEPDLYPDFKGAESISPEAIEREMTGLSKKFTSGPSDNIIHKEIILDMRNAKHLEVSEDFKKSPALKASLQTNIE